VSVTRSVVPGEWYGVLGDRVIVLLPPAAKARVAGLWETVDDGAGFDEVLDAVISGGLRDLPAFVLVSTGEGETRMVIRGPARAELQVDGETVRLTGSDDTTWVEQNVVGVTALRIRVADGTGPAYTVGSGLVRIASVEHPAKPVPGPTTLVPDAEVVAVPVEPPEPPRPARILPPDPQLQKPPAAAPEPEPVTEAMAAVVAPVSGATSGPSAEDLAQPSEPTPGSAESSVVRLVFSSGEVVDVDRPVVVGRAPDQGRYAGEVGVRLITVPSPHHEISSTHLEVRPGSGSDEGAAVATDLGSTNGTVVVVPGLPAEDLRPGVGVRLMPGSTIDLGEGVTIQVTRV